MTNKVFTGTTSIKEHIEQLGELYQREDVSSIQFKPVDTMGVHEQQDITRDTPRKQSIEIQQLKRDAGLIK